MGKEFAGSHLQLRGGRRDELSENNYLSLIYCLLFSVVMVTYSFLFHTLSFRCVVYFLWLHALNFVSLVFLRIKRDIFAAVQPILTDGFH